MIFNIKNKKSFTLVEILIVIALLIVLFTAIILFLNPQEYFKRGRDSQRLEDLNKLTRVISWFEADTGGREFMGTSSIVYISLPDSNPNCSSFDLPPLPSGWSYRCVTSSTLQNTDGNGWIPINFNKISFGRSINKLPIDPINNSFSYYSYVYDEFNKKFEINALLESLKYKDVALKDGGDNEDIYESGSKLSLNPVAIGGSVGGGGSNSSVGFFKYFNDLSIYSVKQLSNGNYLIAGDYFDINNDNNEVFIGLINSSFNILWIKKIGLDTYNDSFSFLLNISDNEYLLVGQGTSYAPEFPGYSFFVKVNNNGEIVNSKKMGYQGVNSIFPTNDGGYILGGNGPSITKIDNNFNLQWHKTITGSDGPYDVWKIIQNSNNNYILAGEYYSYDRGFDIFVLEISSNGNSILWSKYFSGISDDHFRDIEITSDGGYIVLGHFYDEQNSYINNNLVMKLSSNGVLQWIKSIGSNSNDMGQSIIQTTTGEYIITGFTYLNNEADIFFLKLSSNGQYLSWVKLIDYSINDYPAEIQLSYDGDYILSGMISSPDNKGFLIKIDSNGNIQNCSLIQDVTSQFQIGTPLVNVNNLSLGLNTYSLLIEDFPSNIDSINRQIYTICPI